jgi:hypothetical protein
MTQASAAVAPTTTITTALVRNALYSSPGRSRQPIDRYHSIATSRP